MIRVGVDHNGFLLIFDHHHEVDRNTYKVSRETVLTLIGTLLEMPELHWKPGDSPLSIPDPPNRIVNTPSPETSVQILKDTLEEGIKLVVKGSDATEAERGAWLKKAQEALKH